MKNPFDIQRMPVPTRPMSDSSKDLLRQADLLLENADPKPDFKTVWKILKRIPKEERDLDWGERLVTLYVLSDTKPILTSKLNNRLAGARRRAGEPEKFNEFAKQLERKIAPYRMTLHGKVLPFKNRDPLPVVDDVLRLTTFLNKNGYPNFINSGTLLGAVREGGFLPHDDDVDLAVYIRGDTMDERISEMRSLRRLIKKSGLNATPVKMRGASPILKFDLPSEISVDLFAFWLIDGRAYIWPHTYGELTEDQIFPLGTATLHDVELPAPAESEDMLAINYGPDWRSPDSLFRFDWVAANKRFGKELDIYLRQNKTLRRRLIYQLKKSLRLSK